jgi:hypothetical protein
LENFVAKPPRRFAGSSITTRTVQDLATGHQRHRGGEKPSGSARNKEVVRDSRGPDGLPGALEHLNNWRIARITARKAHLAMNKAFSRLFRAEETRGDPEKCEKQPFTTTAWPAPTRPQSRRF